MNYSKPYISLKIDCRTTINKYQRLLTFLAADTRYERCIRLHTLISCHSLNQRQISSTAFLLSNNATRSFLITVTYIGIVLLFYNLKSQSGTQNRIENSDLTNNSLANTVQMYPNTCLCLAGCRLIVI